MASNLGKPESENADVTTADGTPAPETPEGNTASENQPTTTPQSPAAEEPKVAGVDDYEKKLQAAMAPKETPAATEDQPQPGHPAEKDPASTETPDETPDADPAPDADTPATPETTVPDRIRLSGLSEKSRALVAAATLLAKSEKIEFDEAYARLSATPAKVETPEKTEDQPAETTPQRTLAEVEADIKAAKEERRNAIRNLDADKQIETEDRLDALEGEKATLARAESEKVSQEQAEFDAAVDKSQADAARFYPVLADKDHAIHAKADAIWAVMEKTGNPIVSSADAPLRIYQMAANELGIPPVDPDAAPSSQKSRPQAPASPSATPKPQAVAQTAVVRPNKAPGIASGAERTTQPGHTPKPIERIRTASDYERKVAELSQSAA